MIEYIFSPTVYGIDRLPNFNHFLIGIIFHALGCFFYVSRSPERFIENKFDFLGSSHQLFHVFGFIGILYYYYGCLELLNYRLDNRC